MLKVALSTIINRSFYLSKVQVLAEVISLREVLRKNALGISIQFFLDYTKDFQQLFNPLPLIESI